MARRLPEAARVLAHCVSGRLVVALSKRLCLIDAPSQGRQHNLRLQELLAVDAAEPRTSISDGRTDRQGFLVFGTANQGPDGRPIGSFFQYSHRYGLRRLALPAVTRATSICFDASGTRMYFADGACGRIDRCDYDAESGRVANIKPFVVLDAGALPRGAVVDAEGCLWSAQSGHVVRYAPDGSVLQMLDIDCDAPAFGGPAMDQLACGGAEGLRTLAPSSIIGMADAAFDDRSLDRRNKESFQR